MSPIFSYALEDMLAQHIMDAPFYPLIDLADFIRITASLCSVCVKWTVVSQYTLFQRLTWRNDALVRIHARQLIKTRRLFPTLNFCVLEVTDAEHISAVENMRSEIQRAEAEFGPLDFITAVSMPSYAPLGRPIVWDKPDTMEIPVKTILTSFAQKKKAEQKAKKALPLFYSEYVEKVVWRQPEVTDTFVDEMLSVCYFHAHKFREALSHLHALQYIELPSFMLPPLLCSDFLRKPASTKLLELMNLSYDEYGEMWLSIASRIPYLHIISLPNPAYMLKGDCIPGQDSQRDGYRYHVGMRTDPILREHIRKIFYRMEIPSAMTESLQGFGFRGKEAVSYLGDILNDPDAVILHRWDTLKNSSLKKFSLVSGGVRNVSTSFSKNLLLLIPEMRRRGWGTTNTDTCGRFYLFLHGYGVSCDD